MQTPEVPPEATAGAPDASVPGAPVASAPAASAGVSLTADQWTKFCAIMGPAAAKQVSPGCFALVLGFNLKVEV